MAFTDKWSRATILTACRRELSDPSARFWSDTNLETYISDWQRDLQNEFEFVWGTATYTNTVTSMALSTITDLLRLDAIYCNGTRLIGKNKLEMEDYSREWRVTTSGTAPYIAFQNDDADVVFWPLTTSTKTLIFEYPAITTFAASTSTMQIPAWTRYSSINYVTYHALLQEGPANSPDKSLRYKRYWEDNLKQFKSVRSNYLPDRALRLKPSQNYAASLAKGSLSNRRFV
jgi:hypothetical protein